MLKPGIFIAPHGGHVREPETGILQPIKTVEIVATPQHKAATFGVVEQVIPRRCNRGRELLISCGAKGAGIVADLNANINDRHDDTDDAADLCEFLEGHVFFLPCGAALAAGFAAAGLAASAAATCSTILST